MNNKVLLFIAVSMGLLSAMLVHNYLTGLEPLQQPEMVEVVVASRRISSNSTINREMVERRRVSVDAIHPEAIFDINEINGRITTSEIVAGEQVLHSRVLPLGQIPGLSFTIPADMRAMTIAVNEVVGVAGFIKPGDKVDILATFAEEQPFTITVLENVMVLAIAQEMENKQNPSARVSTSVTLALNPQQTEKLTLSDERASLRLSLRPPEAAGIASRQGTSMENLHPLAYANNGLTDRQEISTRTSNVVAASAPASNDVASARAINISPPDEPQRTVEVVRGVSREVRVVHE